MIWKLSIFMFLGDYGFRNVEITIKKTMESSVFHKTLAIIIEEG